MLSISKATCDMALVEKWLNESIRPHLRQDVSNYAKGRLRTWLNIEPKLIAPFDLMKGTPVHAGIINRFKEIIEWDFDFCLATYSGDEIAIGIDPHRDAGYSDFEAKTLQVSAECKFSYWEGRPDTRSYTTVRSFKIDPKEKVVFEDGIIVPPTHTHILLPGDITTFNCKNPHSAEPTAKRWNLNFWKAKPRK